MNEGGLGPKPRGREASGAVRMSDVARLAQVSPITVSRCLQAPGRVAPETRDRIRAAMESLGYVPNLVAGTLASNRSRMVAALVPTLAQANHAATIDALTTRLNQAGLQVLLGSTGYSDIAELDLVRTFLGYRPQAMVLTGVTHSPEAARLLQGVGIPIVETLETGTTPLDMAVGFQNAAAGATVARHLMARGCRQPAVLTHGAASDTRAADRHRGFVAQVRACGGVEPLSVPVDPADLAGGAAGLERLLIQASGVDAVFCVSDTLALGALMACRRLGVAVPERLALIGFGDSEPGALVQPALSTVHVPKAEIGDMAAAMILARLSGQESASRVVDLGFRLVVRDSG